MNKILVKVAVILCVAVMSFAFLNTMDVFEPELSKDVALQQLKNDDFEVQKMRAYNKGKSVLLVTFGLLPVFVGLALFYPELKKMKEWK